MSCILKIDCLTHIRISPASVLYYIICEEETLHKFLLIALMLPLCRCQTHSSSTSICIRRPYFSPEQCLTCFPSKLEFFCSSLSTLHTKNHVDVWKYNTFAARSVSGESEQWLEAISINPLVAYKFQLVSLFPNALFLYIFSYICFISLAMSLCAFFRVHSFFLSTELAILFRWVKTNKRTKWDTQRYYLYVSRMLKM